ncbi:HXXEE domain-containing protein [Salinicola endophyticus]|nr:HXXEE domain-containing protein [Salinicola endophyticus]
MSLLYWAPLGVALCHLIEEFAWPGGFRQWYAWYRPDIAASLTPGFLLRINVIMILVAVWVGYTGPASAGAIISGWLVLMSILANNALFHLVATFRGKRYSPGVVTGCLLYLPLFVMGVIHFWMTQSVSLTAMVLSVALGSLYQAWSLHTHKRRSRAHGMSG